MSSPTRDDYEGLVTPWNPVYDSMETDNDAQHEDLKDHETDSIDANDIADDGVQEGSEMRDSGTTDVQKVNAAESIGDGSDENDSHRALKDSAMRDFGTANVQNADDLDNVGSGSGGDEGDDGDDDGAQSDGAEVADADNDPPQIEDEKCVAVPTCLANSGDHRKVVSHIFGRNKACTRELPNGLWIYWCRKHYQRLKYRAEDSESWHTRQLGLVRNQLQIFEVWGQVRAWTITLRKAEKDAIAKEDKNGVTYNNYISTCWERFLVPYLGAHKTFAQVREVLDLIERKFNEAEYRNREKKFKTFPGVEFLPAVHKAKEVKKPALKKGEVGYKKITLDQAAFKRKTRVNSEIIKDMAAKKEASNTPRSSHTPSKKGKTPDTDTKKDKTPDTDNDNASDASDASAVKKRKSPATEDAVAVASEEDTARQIRRVTPPSWIYQPFPTKRRRLTRGFDKHVSDSDDTPSKDNEKEKKNEV